MREIGWRSPHRDLSHRLHFLKFTYLQKSMLPTEPKSDLSDLTVSQTKQPEMKHTQISTLHSSILKFTHKAGNLAVKYPFWALVASSLGIHAAFAFITPNPLKKTETPPEPVVVSTLPVVKLPPKSPITSSNKSLFSNLFVKPIPNKIGTPLNSFPNTSLNSPLTSLDLNSPDNLEDLPPLSSDFSGITTSPLSKYTREPDQSVKPQPRVSTPPTNPPSRFTASGQIDNSNPPTKLTNNSNLRPEFQNGGIKNQPTSPTSPPQNNSNTKPTQTPNNSQGSQGLVASNSHNGDRNEAEIVNISSPYPTNDQQFIDLLSKQAVINTRIVPEGKLISATGPEREKGVEWIAPKVSSVAGKSGSVIFMWLVDPSGKVKKLYLKSSGFKELDDIAKETAKEYKFKPLEDPQSGKFRLVTAKYEFP
ncbi:energy transducer TonB [Pseudanabaena sp. 'Roaring Creek']|uniref:energy transducer TonB n=1 Tax=Pseudanabaena sp. 'Roaring Creek' TaxID=1681830 RepID=UPI0018D099D4|nr:energy transducer TonB [Pseudanabaena sp. 'Roaring Creek']